MLVINLYNDGIDCILALNIIFAKYWRFLLCVVIELPLSKNSLKVKSL